MHMEHDGSAFRNALARGRIDFSFFFLVSNGSHRENRHHAEMGAYLLLELALSAQTGWRGYITSDSHK